MIAPAIQLRDTNWIEIADHGGSIEVAWVAPCACRGNSRLVWFGVDYIEARAAAARWATVLGLPVRDLARLN
jgi:hypothetical protein